MAWDLRRGRGLNWNTKGLRTGTRTIRDSGLIGGRSGCGFRMGGVTIEVTVEEVLQKRLGESLLPEIERKFMVSGPEKTPTPVHKPKTFVCSDPSVRSRWGRVVPLESVQGKDEGRPDGNGDGTGLCELVEGTRRVGSCT